MDESPEHKERQRLMDDILKHLDDDAPREAYADYLEKNGQEKKGQKARAAFIRSQCLTHKLKTYQHGNGPLTSHEIELYTSLAQNENPLFEKFGAAWRAEEDPPAEVMTQVEYERGFAYFGAIDWATVDRKKLAEVMETHPIQGLVVHGLTESNCAEFLAQDWVPQLRHLILEGNETLGDRGVTMLTASPKLSRLTHLNLNECGVTYEGARELAQSRNLQSIIVLRLQRNNITAQGAYDIAQSKSFPNLWKLTVREASKDRAFYAALDRKKMGNLTESSDGGQKWCKPPERKEETTKPKATPDDVIRWSQGRLRRVLLQPTDASLVQQTLAA